MGYDCTLHLVDERAVREEFVPRLLELRDEPTSLDRVLKDAPKLWQTVRAALSGDDAEEAASLVCQLAVMFSACSLPHQYERGFALSLWSEQESETAADYPTEFVFSPQPLFDAVVTRYPNLNNRFPQWFSGNGSTGVFVPSRQVPAVLAWVEQTVARFDKGPARQFKGLLGILRAAADKGLAYWEATDLAVPMANEFPGDPSLMIARYLGNEPAAPVNELEKSPPGAHVSGVGREIVGSWFVSGDYRPFGTNFWDLSVWPPLAARTLSEFAPHRAISRGGKWLLLSETNAAASLRTFRPRLHTDLAGAALDMPALLGGEEVRVSRSAFVGETPVVFRDPPHDVKPGDTLYPPLWWTNGRWMPLPGLPELPARVSKYDERWIDDPAIGVAPLADQSDVVIWDGDGYELRGDAFEKTFAMGAREPEGCWSCVSSGTDGFYYLSERRLFEVHRGAAPVAHSPKWTNIMYVRPGPDGGILVQEGDNKNGDVGKLYFPDSKTFIHIEPELFDDREYAFIYWSESADRFIVLCDDFLAIRTARVLGLPRYNALTGRKAKS